MWWSKNKQTVQPPATHILHTVTHKQRHIGPKNGKPGAAPTTTEIIIKKQQRRPPVCGRYDTTDTEEPHTRARAHASTIPTRKYLMCTLSSISRQGCPLEGNPSPWPCASTPPSRRGWRSAKCGKCEARKGGGGLQDEVVYQRLTPVRKINAIPGTFNPLTMYNILHLRLVHVIHLFSNDVYVRNCKLRGIIVYMIDSIIVLNDAIKVDFVPTTYYTFCSYVRRHTVLHGQQ